ncbi:MAG: phenylalanine--tRNA ligase beta subunit-related protein [Thermoleophilia bacterium]|nr:phenylalanine--tRNA ligase beta subunit-related protein [Thermoleophilia bacterium]
MSHFVYRVSPEIFARFPGYVRGVVLGFDVTNGPSPPELVAKLREAEESVRSRLTLDKIAEEPRIKCWREAYRSFGARPADFRSSVEAMARRALRSEEIPSINALVDIGNIISLRHLVPAGGHAIDVLRGDIELRFAEGDEEFVAFGSSEVENPLPGEVIFVEGKTVLTRRWTWRQANHTLTLPETTAIEFNVDGLPPVTREEIEIACQELADLVQQFCGGKVRIGYLTAETPSLPLTP